jgi:aryl-alcohol dehydrogenase-like predicted oxidoreductase
MERVILSRTGLSVSVAGLGGGGHSKLGLEKYGEEHAVDIVRRAFESGVNFFDTAAVYGTEPALGRGLSGIARDKYVISSKFHYVEPSKPMQFPFVDTEGTFKKPEELMETLENCLRALKTDYVDIYHLHGVAENEYIEARDTYMPVMQKAKEQGKLRFFGITERFVADPSHKMLEIALADNIFDVVMTGYNLLNPSAAKTVIPAANKNDVGVLCMFAVRSALSNPKRLKANIDKIIERGQGGGGLVSSEKALDFLKDSGAAGSVIEAAYRFCRHTPGVGVTLTGTSDPGHLEKNLRSILMPALPDDILQKLDTLFGNVDCVNLE